MKKLTYIFALFSFFMMMGCGGKKADVKVEERQIFQIDSVDENTGIQRMQTSHIDQTIECKGKKFRLLIDREPDASLPVVKSIMGVFADNRISVRITRENGTQLFAKTFTKSDFEAHLPDDYLRESVLEGLVFDDVKSAENKEITLAASVSYPMTDLYIPFTLVVSQSGKLSLAKDEDMGELTPMEEE